jgi:hypothetical protein
MHNRWKLRGLAVLLALRLSTAVAKAAPVVDQVHDAIGGAGVHSIESIFSVAQTFTMGLSGLLAQVDLMLNRTTDTTSARGRRGPQPGRARCHATVAGA